MLHMCCEKFKLQGMSLRKPCRFVSGSEPHLLVMETIVTLPASDKLPCSYLLPAECQQVAEPGKCRDQQQALPAGV